MNTRMFSIALLISALPLFARAEGISLNKGDFLSAERVKRNGEVILRMKLSKSGKAKFKKLNQTSVNEEVHSEVAGVSTDLRLRVPIQGSSLEMGPYSEADAKRILEAYQKK